MQQTLYAMTEIALPLMTTSAAEKKESALRLHAPVVLFLDIG
jgi:hypothetical protein